MSSFVPTKVSTGAQPSLDLIVWRCRSWHTMLPYLRLVCPLRGAPRRSAELQQRVLCPCSLCCLPWAPALCRGSRKCCLLLAVLLLSAGLGITDLSSAVNWHELRGESPRKEKECSRSSFPTFPRSFQVSHAPLSALVVLNPSSAHASPRAPGSSWGARAQRSPRMGVPCW